MTTSIYGKKRINFDNLVLEWQFYMDSYTGGLDYCKTDYLDQGKVEKYTNYLQRLKRSAYVNYCKQIVQNYSKFVYQKNISRTNVDLIIERIHTDQGNLDDYFRDGLNKMLVEGEVFANYYFGIPDLTSSIDESYEEDYGQNFDVTLNMPFVINLEMILPQYIQYFDENMVIQLVPIYNQQGFVQQYNYIVWEKETITKYNGNAKIKTYNNPMKTIPFVRFIIDEDNNGDGESLIKDISRLNNRIYNILSAICNEAVNTSFSSLIVPWSMDIQRILESMLPKETTPDGQKTLNLSGQDVILYPDSASKSLQFLEKSVDGINIKLNLIKELIDMIYTSSNNKMAQLLNQSGTAKAYDLYSFNAQLSMIASIMERFEKQLFEKIIYSLGINQTQDWNINYNKSYDLIDKEKRIQGLINMLNIQNVPVVAKRQAIMEITSYYLNPTEELNNEIKEEVSKMDFAPIEIFKENKKKEEGQNSEENPEKLNI